MKNKKSAIEIVKKYALILLGCLCFSFGVALFLDNGNLASGGATGIAIMINHLITEYAGVEIGTGWLILIINVPLFILGGIFFGKKFVLSSVIATGTCSGLIELWRWLIVPHMSPFEDVLIPVIVGGALYGAGVGFIFKAGSSTGGTDIIIKLLHRKFRHIKTGRISFAIDAVIVGISYFVYRDVTQLFYTALSIGVFSVALDFVLYSTNTAKLVYIITSKDKVDSMCTRILKDLDVGATLYNGKGAYSRANKPVIMCVVKNHMYPALLDIIKEEDPSAFTIISSANEIYGEGYKSHSEEM